MAATSERHVVVVGAGIGGLVSALLLACQGVRVTVVEKALAPGGKMRQVMAGGAAIDAGPTVFTMRWVFDQIFAAAGVRLEDRLGLAPLDVLARHAWRGGSRLDLFADAQRSAQAIGELAGAAEARRFLGFCQQAKQVYTTLEGPYIRSPRPNVMGLGADLGLRGLGVLAGLGPFASLWRSLARHFHDPRLQQLFGRYATYCGSSPFEAPATLMLIAQVEMDGVWQLRGGMHALARALADLGAERGVSFRYGHTCHEIVVRQGRAAGVRLQDAQGGAVHIDADAVVFNGDVGALSAGLLGPSVTRAVPAVRKAQRSLSALTWAVHARATGFPLVRHNVFFDDDYASEFRDIFGHGRLPSKGTVYVCAQDRGDVDADGDDDAAVHAPQRLLCLVNAPAVGDGAGFNPSEIDACETDRFALLAHCGLQIEPAPAGSTVRTGPKEFEALFPATGGALYGQASHGWMASFRRPGSTCRLPGLYLAGGSVHPGPGVPMAAMSGRLAAATLMAHLDSTSRSSRVAISGGISTPSVTTVATD